MGLLRWWVEWFVMLLCNLEFLLNLFMLMNFGIDLGLFVGCFVLLIEDLL